MNIHTQYNTSYADLLSFLLYIDTDQVIVILNSDPRGVLVKLSKLLPLTETAMAQPRAILSRITAE